MQGTGNINIGTSAQPISGATFSGSSSIVTSAGTGTTSISLNGGTVQANDAAGDFIRSAGGPINMTLTGGTNLVNGSGGINAVLGIHVVGGSTGDVTIVSKANMGGGGGSAMHRGISVGDGLGGVSGNVSITLTGGTITYAQGTSGLSPAGVAAQTSTGDVAVTMQNGSLITGTGGGTWKSPRTPWARATSP